MDIKTLLDQLGIVAPTNSRPRRTTAKAVLQAADKIGASRVATAPKQSKPSAKFSSKKYTPTVAWSDQPDPSSDEDAGFGWDTIGGIFKTALKIVDTPRSYVMSAAKELGDAGNNFLSEHANWVPHWDNSEDEHGSASWNDFLTQAKNHYGGQDMIHDVTGINETGSWHDVDNILGFGLDATADPLTYVGAGGFSRTASKGADAAITAAVRNGGRNEIAKAVAKRVVETGTEGADTLIANAGRKGAAALTKKGLKEAGITAEKAAELGLPKRAYGLLGFEIKGSAPVSDLITNVKGAAKEVLGETSAARLVRRLKISDQFGERGFINAIRDAKGNPMAQAAAVKSLATVNVSKAQTFGWLTEKLQTLKTSDLGRVLRKGSKLEKEVLIDATEGVAERTALNEFFDGLHNDLTEKFGVDLGHRENYVPHILTDEARALEVPEVKEIIDAIQNNVGFQNSRLLNETITVANAKFMEKHGVKLFEDDPNTIILKYLHQATNAVGKATQKQALIDMGVASVIPGLTAEETQKALLGLDVSNATREEYMGVAVDYLRKEKASVLRQIDEIEKGTQALARKADTAQRSVTTLEGKLEALKSQLALAKKAVKPGRAAAKQAKLVKAIEDQIVDVTQRLATAKAAVKEIFSESTASTSAKATASKSFVQETKALEAQMVELTAKHMDLTERLEALKAKVAASGVDPVAAEAEALNVAEKVAKTTEALGTKRAEEELATGIYDMAIADRPAVINVLDKQAEELKNVMRKLGRKRNPKGMSGKADYADLLMENVQIAKEAIGASDDPAVQLLARLEATAASIDATHLDATARWSGLLDNMKDPKFKVYMEQQVTDGWQRLNESYQIPDWADQALRARNVFNDNEWGRLIKFYDKSLNLMKGYMIARPGFVVRNAYSSLFNVYLEAGADAFGSLKTYRDFYTIFRKNPENYRELALAKWGDQELVDRLEQALHVSSATGGGLAPDEFNVGFLDGVSANPLSADFAPIKAVRAASERVEHLVRGGHAFDVLQRGGSTDLAVDTINKWHFNYRDLTEFDRNAKRVMPFWTFFSRNMALQASSFQSVLPKLNRTYFNAQRNLESGQEPDLMPGYFQSSNPLRIGQDGSTTKYLFPDLPPLQAQTDIRNIINSKGSSLAAGMTPALKIPLDLFSDKQSFSGIPFSDEYKADTPIWAELPGAGLLPGVEQGGTSGNNVVTDRTQYVYENLFPPLGQGNRLADTTKGSNPLMAWLGLSVRDNTEKSRLSEKRRRDRALKAEMQRIMDLENA